MPNKWNEQEAVKFIRKRIQARLIVAGQVVQDSASQLCPVDLGNLRKSIIRKLDEDELSVRIGTPVEYAPYIEFGTGEFAENGQGRKGGWFYRDEKTGKLVFTFGNKPQPFLRPALLANKDRIKSILGA